ncbi:hypothetical protein RM61_07215 [Xanthomonas phaseoli pv. phaseoli]|uniref:hypothetical protein n=1 Tax=Xanthomonas phaseoli TaxID=1985254 RepID=UPI0005748084|nr:hypothetical protein [Xanthomonas phaseoli]KHS08008.1 hypothetical protein RM61_07215 [Xanthomonas phaseoli pv. phaseoli]
MADPDDLFRFNLSDPEDTARWERIYMPRSGDRLSSPFRRLLDELLARWNRSPEVIEAIRSRAESILTHMDLIEERAGSLVEALQDPLMGAARAEATNAIARAALELDRAALELERADVEPYVRAGRAVEEARAAGGRAKARNMGEPEWHARVVKAAQQLRDAGEPDRNLVGILVERFPYSDDAVRRVLRKHGVLPAANG